MRTPDRPGAFLRTAAAAALLCLPAPGQTNLLKNAGFEEGQGKRAAHWEPAKTAGKKGVAERSDERAHSGRYSLRISPNKNNRGSDITSDPIGAGQGFPAKEFLGRRVTVSAWLSASGGATATVAVYAIGRSGPRFVELNRASSPREWERLSAELEIPASGIDFLVVLCLAKGTSGHAVIDDVSLTMEGSAAAAPPPAGETVTQGGRAVIRVDASRVVREIPRQLYGANIEWIWDANGIWDAGADRLQPEIVSLTRELGPSLLRFPGGIFSDFYHWRDGIGPRELRKKTAHSPSGGESVHRFGTDEALEFARQAGGELLITVNVATGTPQEAAAWVRYVNGQGRRVTYWEVGNEVYVKDNSPHSKASTMTPEEYAAKFIEFSRAMKAADPGIKVGALGEENYGNAYRSYPGWTETVLQRAAPEMDFIAVHNGYAPAIVSERGLSTGDVYRAMLAAPAQIAQSLEALRRKIAQADPEHSGRIRIAVTEWGPYFQVTSAGKWVDHHKTLAAALYTASALKVFIEQPRMEIANAFKLVDPLYMGWIGKRAGQYVPTAGYYAMQLFTRHFGNRLVRSRANGPAFDSPAVGWVREARNVPVLDVVSSLDNTGRTLYVTVINKDLTNDVTAAVEVAGIGIGGRAAVHTLNGTSADANTGTEPFQAPGVKWARQAEFEPGGRFSEGGGGEIQLQRTGISADSRFEYRFPAHSITAFELSTK